MFPNAFRYYAPETTDEFFELVEQHGLDGKIMAGGQSLLPLMKLRLAAPAVLIDANRLASWSGITESAEELTIGALARHSDLEHGVWAAHPVMARAARQIADPIVRNRGTMAGSLAHADPAADWGAVLLALNASVEIQSRSGGRTVPVSEFFVDTFTTVLEPNEAITAIHIPRLRDAAFVGGEYLKLERKVGDFAVIGAAVTAGLDREGRVIRAGIGLAAVGPTPLRASRTEERLLGERLSPDVIHDAAAIAAHECSPTSDRRGSETYKRNMVRVFVERGLSAICTQEAGNVSQSA